MRTTFLTSFFNKNDNNTPTINTDITVDLTEPVENQPTNIPLTNRNQITLKMTSEDLKQRSTVC